MRDRTVPQLFAEARWNAVALAAGLYDHDSTHYQAVCAMADRLSPMHTQEEHMSTLLDAITQAREALVRCQLVNHIAVIVRFGAREYNFFFAADAPSAIDYLRRINEQERLHGRISALVYDAEHTALTSGSEWACEPAPTPFAFIA